ncbi:carbonic anhydrase 15-like isoform X2 [Periplaneta americana]|uniref:carbonic anhydrase 15-like isoform X2 n=1 Tax=Periplaneta americana TaxID=6978 RepID=UPI0037E8F820
MSPGRAVAARLLLILAGPILLGVPSSGDVWSYKEGEHVMLTVEQPCEIVMAAGGLPGVYRLEQIHFHWKSEHTLRGRRWPLEMHMVHFDRQYLKLNEAVRHHQGLAVLAVLFYETEEPNKGLQTILDAIAKVSHTEKTPYKIPQAVSLEELVPDEKNRFYRYAGSLTTPNCDESVVWTVLTQPVPIGKDQVQQFHKVQTHNEPLRSNYRPLQKLDNRRIYLQHPSQESASNTKQHSWFITVLLLAMLSVTV